MRRGAVVGLLWLFAASGCVDWDGARAAFCGNGPVCNSDAWSRRLGGAGLETAAGLALSPSGEIVIAGLYSGQSELGAAPLPESGQNDLFVASYRADGGTTFTSAAGGSANDAAAAVVVDSFGNSYVTGTFSSGDLKFSAELTFTRAGNQDAFIAQYDPAGAATRAVRLGGSGATVFGRDVAVIPSSGVVYGAGSFTGMVNFGPSGATSASEVAYLVRLSPAGVVDRVLFTDTCASGRSSADAVVVDSLRNLYVAGQYEGSCNLPGGSPLPSAGSPGLFVVKLDEAGSVVWKATFPEANVSGRVHAAVDRKDNLLVTSPFKGTVTLKDGTRVESHNHSTTDALLLKLERTAGLAEWGIAGGASGNDQGLDVTADLENNAWFCGSMEGTAAGTFGNLSINGGGGLDAFLVGISETGSTIDLHTYGDLADQSATGVAAAADALILVGQFGGQINVGSGALTARGTDLFLGRLPR